MWALATVVGSIVLEHLLQYCEALGGPGLAVGFGAGYGKALGKEVHVVALVAFVHRFGCFGYFYLVL